MAIVDNLLLILWGILFLFFYHNYFLVLYLFTLYFVIALFLSFFKSFIYM